MMNTRQIATKYLECRYNLQRLYNTKLSLSQYVCANLQYAMNNLECKHPDVGQSIKHYAEFGYLPLTNNE